MILVADRAADAAPPTPTPWARRPFHADPLAGMRSTRVAGLTVTIPIMINTGPIKINSC